MSEDENLRHHDKMQKKKAARDKIMAGKTIEKGLLIVHTGKGKGKSTAAFGMVFRCIGHGMKAGIVQFVKGAFEIAATIDYMFAFAATTGAVASHHFDLAYDAFLADDETRDFIASNNPAALKEISERLEEAIARGLWTPRSNSAYAQLKFFKEGHLP